MRPSLPRLGSVGLVAPVALLALVTGAACDESPPPDTSRYDVSELSASMSADSDGQTLTVRAALVHGFGELLPLGGDDVLVARVDGVGETSMVRRDGDEVRYFATFPSRPGSAHVVVDFRRGGGRPGAPFSDVTLAPSFTVSDVPRSLRVGADLPLRIDPPEAAGGIDLVFHGDGISGTARPKSEDGVVTFVTTSLTWNGHPLTAQVEARAETSGSVDSAFARGLFGKIAEMEGVEKRAFSIEVGR